MRSSKVTMRAVKSRPVVACVGLVSGCVTSQQQPTVHTGPPVVALAPSTPLPFVEDDYPGAVATARARKLPLFVDAWAPWCHTCRYLRATVMSDPALAKYADQFVWLSIDTDKAVNAPFAEKFPQESRPTLFFIDPEEETPRLRWAGSLTLQSFEALLDEGARAVREPDRGGSALSEGDRLWTKGDGRAAADAYARTLRADTLSGPERGRQLESLVQVLERSAQEEACARAVIDEAARVPRRCVRGCRHLQP
jgi:thiol-disulfide isomerase/thioredoxin